jgi:hypothetical protein
MGEAVDEWRRRQAAKPGRKAHPNGNVR